MRFIIFLSATAVLFFTIELKAEVYSEEISQNISMGEYGVVRDDLEILVQGNPNDYWAQKSLGKSASAQGDYSDALVAFQRAMMLRQEQEIDDWSLYNSLGWTKFQLGDTFGGIDDIQLALDKEESLSPAVANAAYNNLGLIYIHLDDLTKAREAFNRAIEEYDSEIAAENIELLERLEHLEQEFSVEAENE